MAEKGYTKLKLLYIKQYLEKYSDEENLVKADELIEMLQSQYPDYVKEINQTGDITEAVEKIFTKTMLEFK